MNARFAKIVQVLNSILVSWLILISVSACGSAATPSTFFDYPVHVQDKITGADLEGAEVRIENTSFPPSAITDNAGIARISINSSRESQPATLVIQKTGYKKYVRGINLYKNPLLTVVQLEPEQSPIPSIPTSIVETPSSISPTSTPASTLTSTLKITPTDRPPTAHPPSCLWTFYPNGVPATVLGKNCLNDLLAYGISGDSQQQPSFFVRGSRTGTYGVCKDISQKNNLQLNITIRDDSSSVRFLVSIGPEPIPTQSSYTFEIQPERGKIYLNEWEAPAYWKSGRNWLFDFALQFKGVKASAVINQMPAPYEWSSDPANRYLCFAYQLTSTAAQLDASVNFP